MLTIANVRRAAQSLKAEGNDVSHARLASRLHLDLAEVRRFVSGINGLEKELDIIVADYSFRGLVYMHAADKLRQRGERVTIAALAKELGIGREGVQNALRRNPERARLLGIVSQGSINLEIRERMYADVIHNLFRRRKPISAAEIARQTSFDKGSIHKDLEKMPGLKDFLKKC
ncbi:hypothetical protein A2853_02525 [Candidatus Kaiserbacteria bacterium RIFCSPHIGHO2_01_FULL_55_17]|uniref:Uncharacterized protein n=1 Tax=Candidatus Kaiserbacteria bacterium RIFCSPHIGHO2_01_FULL_55_17 TaxID=1798484 RepID=A0A1F6D7F7_9BACT|nr:MAG: hypothetical protein A2853_02525 [Candidatus Kaiserbacteria bacterium RIFCSPHIGHO2_01_FULL_55_17]